MAEKKSQKKSGQVEENYNNPSLRLCVHAYTVSFGKSARAHM
jgi:hypothetical protein